MVRVLTSQRAGDVGIVPICSRVGPDVVIPGLEAVDYCRVIAEVPCSIYIIGKWIVRPNIAVTEIGAGKNNFILAGE
jgi:hypothetical protein